MIGGEAPDPLPVEEIAPAVAHIGNHRHLLLHIGRHQGGAHSFKLLELPGLVIDRGVGQAHRVAEHLPRLLLGHARLAETIYLLDKHIQGKGAGHIARLGPAHTVADGAEHTVFSKWTNLKCILVLDPDTAGICQSPCLHGRTSLRCLFKLYQFFPGIAIISTAIAVENSPCAPSFHPNHLEQAGFAHRKRCKSSPGRGFLRLKFSSQLAAGGVNVPAQGPADRGGEAAFLQNALKLLHRLAGAGV